MGYKLILKDQCIFKGKVMLVLEHMGVESLISGEVSLGTREEVLITSRCELT